MKLKIFFLAILLTNVKASEAQLNTDYISTLRIGVFKINATVSDIEKITGKKIRISAGKDEYFDSTKLHVDNSDVLLVFNKSYQADEKAPALWKLYAVSSKNTQLKTKSGVGIGSTKAEVLAACDKMDITIYNDYEYKEKNNPKDKIQTIILKDYDAETSLVLTTEDRVVKKIEVCVLEEGD